MKSMMLWAMLCLLAVSGCSGCGQEIRVYGEADELIQSFQAEEIDIHFYSEYSAEWSVEVKIETRCGSATLQARNGDLMVTLKDIENQIACIRRECG